jgi:hypothetical protein
MVRCSHNFISTIFLISRKWSAPSKFFRSMVRLNNSQSYKPA